MLEDTLKKIKDLPWVAAVEQSLSLWYLKEFPWDQSWLSTSLIKMNCGSKCIGKKQIKILETTEKDIPEIRYLNNQIKFTNIIDRIVYLVLSSTS